MEEQSVSRVELGKNAIREQRWREEARFFDQVADQDWTGISPVDPLIWKRYSSPRPRRRMLTEFCLRELGNLNGRQLLDVGCGSGSRAVILAKLGAHVTGVDISPRSIELAKHRAEINSVAERVNFLCAPLETVQLVDNTFDIVWCEAILHHLIEDIAPISDLLRKWTKPNGIVIMSEPVNLVNWLRQIRLKLPVDLNGTPDERPLESREIKVLQSQFAEPQMRYFRFFSRIDRFLLPDYQYERAAVWRKLIYNALLGIDYLMLSIPGFRQVGGQLVIYGPPPQVALDRLLPTL